MAAENQVEEKKATVVTSANKREALAPFKTPKAPKEPRAPKEPKAPRAPRAPKPAKVKRVSQLDAAAQVLAKSKSSLSIVEICGAIEKAGTWESPAGKTPGATLSAAINREIKVKGEHSRFAKVERGQYAKGPGA